ncbi:MAG: transcriptional repressor [Schwartzia sp.]|nr:transcriptional repressor [Schwartzia sp. (in: firmicutes)]
MENILEKLRQKGYKITPQRRAVLDAFQAFENFPTAQQLLTAVRKTHPDVSLDTIYRNLSLLTELGAVHEIRRSSGNVYELATSGHHHHHLVCTKCGKTECIDMCPISDAYTKEAEKKGFLITGHIFEFYGLCSDCRKKRK